MRQFTHNDEGKTVAKMPLHEINSSAKKKKQKTETGR
jgi:hypothetical protein